MKPFFMMVIILFNSAAFASTNSCFAEETNPATQQRFASLQDYNSFKESWDYQSPGIVNPIHLLRAYQIYKSEKNLALSLGTDKLAHCYLGCRISQVTNYHTTDYVGWLKELRDLTDCNPQSFFDEEDYRATIRGGVLGGSQPDAKSCESACHQIYN